MFLGWSSSVVAAKFFGAVKFLVAGCCWMDEIEIVLVFACHGKAESSVHPAVPCFWLKLGF